MKQGLLIILHSLILVSLFINSLINYGKTPSAGICSVIYCIQHANKIKGHVHKSVFPDTLLVSSATESLLQHAAFITEVGLEMLRAFAPSTQ